MELITPSSGLLFWMVLIFAIVFFLLAKFGFPVITGMVAKRSEHIEQSLKEAEQAREELANMEKIRQEMINKTRTEQHAMLEDARKAAKEVLDEARTRSREESEEMIKRAKSEIEVSRRVALDEIKSTVASISVAVSEKILRHSLQTTDEQMALITKLVEEKVDVNS